VLTIEDSYLTLFCIKYMDGNRVAACLLNAVIEVGSDCPTPPGTKVFRYGVVVTIRWYIFEY
jgi:hypothetical protein